MRQVTNPSNFRENIVLKLTEIISCKTKSKNLEKGIYNYVIEHAKTNHIVRKWENPLFVELYVNRLRSIFRNLKSNKHLLNYLENNQCNAHEIAFMSHQELCPERWKDLIETKKIRDKYKYTPNIDANTDNFTCRKCKSNRCSYYQLQTRSADEPMTTFVTCINCGNRWKC
tara:strand:+ start:125 stop:637 length:513 start_codon:yes stop_codon:yes gene_type:complete